MSITITLTDENVAGLAWAVELTGLSYEEIVNMAVKDEVDNFQPDSDDSYPHEWIGCWKFRDRKSAERTLEWISNRVKKDRKRKFPILETKVTEDPDGRFGIDVFATWQTGEYTRVV